MSRFNDLTNKTFGRLKVLSATKERRRGGVVWECLCECGRKVNVPSYNLVGNSTNSCGCLRKEYEKSGDIRRTHGMREAPIYWVWSSMKARCLNPKTKNYHRYGGRGIEISTDWVSFEGFYSDMGESYKDGLELDRIDNDGNYDKRNCRWVTSKVNNNNRIDTIRLRYKGEEKSLSEWCKELNLPHKTIYSRIYKGWKVERALETPLPQEEVISLIKNQLCQSK